LAWLSIKRHAVMQHLSAPRCVKRTKETTVTEIFVTTHVTRTMSCSRGMTRELYALKGAPTVQEVPLALHIATAERPLPEPAK